MFASLKDYPLAAVQLFLDKKHLFFSQNCCTLNFLLMGKQMMKNIILFSKSDITMKAIVTNADSQLCSMFISKSTANQQEQQHHSYLCVRMKCKQSVNKFQNNCFHSRPKWKAKFILASGRDEQDWLKNRTKTFSHKNYFLSNSKSMEKFKMFSQ